MGYGEGCDMDWEWRESKDMWYELPSFGVLFALCAIAVRAPCPWSMSKGAAVWMGVLWL